jgi:chromosome segregation ATPase
VTFATPSHLPIKGQARTDEARNGMGRAGGAGPAGSVSKVETRVRTGGERILLGDLANQRERMQAAIVPPPVLTIDPVAIPPVNDQSRRGTRGRAEKLEQVAARNLQAAEEARKALREQQARLERETAARVQAEVRIDALARNLAQLQQQAAQHQAQAKAHALQAARESVSGELAEMAHELDRLRDALGDHDGLLKEYRDRLRVEQEHRQSVQAELERVKTARPWACADGEPASDHDAQIATLGREIDALTQRTEAIKAAAAAEVEDANARVVELEARLAETETRAKDAERSQGKLRREASDAGKARRAAEDLLREQQTERGELFARVESADREIELARADASALRAQVVELQAALTATSAELTAATAELTERPAKQAAERVAVDGLRRDAMAELSALAVTSPSDDLMPRRF